MLSAASPLYIRCDEYFVVVKSFLLKSHEFKMPFYFTATLSNHNLYLTIELETDLASLKEKCLMLMNFFSKIFLESSRENTYYSYTDLPNHDFKNADCLRYQHEREKSGYSNLITNAGNPRFFMQYILQSVVTFFFSNVTSRRNGFKHFESQKYVN